MSKVKDFVLDIFFPNRCPLCGKVIKWNIECCEKCIDDLPDTGEELCYGCGNTKSHCQCKARKLLFERCYAAYYYKDTARSAVLYLKDTKNTFFPRLAAKKIHHDIDEDNYIFHADYVVPVPLSRRKLYTRGYNQSALIGQALADELSIDMKENVILRHDSIIDQHMLGSQMRSISAGAVYYANKNVDIKGKTIILCDDVITTGSTLNECAKILLDMGADRVIAAAAATTE